MINFVIHSLLFGVCVLSVVGYAFYKYVKHRKRSIHEANGYDEDAKIF